MSGIFDWVRSATVQITGLDGNGSRVFVGSGFVVAPGWVFSAAHVVAEAVEPRVWWRGRERTPLAPPLCVPAARGADGSFASPDTAVLQIEAEPDAPCVPLAKHAPVPGSKVWIAGTTTLRSGRPEPYASWLTVADPGPTDELGFMRLQEGQVWFGMSGGPVLDVVAGGVCGITKAAQGKAVSDLGGWAVPIADALGVAPAEVELANTDYHGQTLEALRAAQGVYGGLPKKVLSLFKDHPGALDLLVDHLANLEIEAPSTVTSEQAPEWAVRKLFDLDLLDLVEALFVVKDNLGPALARTVFRHVACCLPVDETPTWWVDAQAAEALRAEAAVDRPRIVRVCTDEATTVRVLLHRAFEQDDIDVRAVAGPFSGEVGDAGLPLDMVAEIFAEIRRKSAVREQDWMNDDGKRQRAARAARLGNRFYALRADAAPDAEQLRALVTLFGGLRFLIARRRLALPESIDDVLLDLTPEVDPEAEEFALAGWEQLNERLDG
ncbi:MAG TPA: serine protease [Kineosporiaceae bacterium]|nr:serine protease [Kineosporiaceae bacterium]